MITRVFDAKASEILHGTKIATLTVNELQESVLNYYHGLVTIKGYLRQYFTSHSFMKNLFVFYLSSNSFLKPVKLK